MENGWVRHKYQWIPNRAIAKVDMSVTKAGIKILVTETTGQKAALFTVNEQGEVIEIPMLLKYKLL